MKNILYSVLFFLFLGGKLLAQDFSFRLVPEENGTKGYSELTPIEFDYFPACDKVPFRLTCGGANHRNMRRDMRLCPATEEKRLAPRGLKPGSTCLTIIV